MLPREIYRVSGPAKVRVRSFTGGGQNETILEARDRGVLFISPGLLSVTLFHGTDIATASSLGVIAANDRFEINSEHHFAFPGEPFIVSSSGVGTVTIVEVFMVQPPNEVAARGPVDWYREQLERRRREKLQRIIDEVPIPECASLLLETPIQFAIRQEMRSAVGGGGGETGSESLDTASPNLSGD